MFPAMMIRMPASLLVFAATVLTATAAPRFALIRVKDIYTGLPSTTAQQEEIKKERDAIMKDPRAEDLRRIIAELQSLQARLSDKNNPLDEETGRKLARGYEIKRQEAQTLQKEFESFRTEREKEINGKMVAGMRASLNRITETSRRIAKERGYDLVFDSSGSTNTGVPFVLWSGKSPDLTDDVKAALKDAAAAAAPPAQVKAPAAPSKPSNPKR
jgi:Skp family chaperone for outer membrane proteins